MREFLRPFRGEYLRYTAGVVLRQALIVIGGYSLVWVLRLCVAHATLPEWLFVAAFMAFDTTYLAFDLRLNYFFSERISYPLFASLRNGALEKVLGMPMEWHQRQSSGELVGEVNSGVGKVVQTVEGLSRELVPALIQTAFSLVPLFLISAITAPLLLPALVIFLWLTIIENRERRPFAKRRYKHYARDFGLFSDSVQAVEPVVRYGQEDQILHKYRRVQQQIQEEGLAEARIGNKFGIRRNFTISAARRICQGVWIWQYRHNVIDAASIMYLNMLTDQLLASFGGYASLLERLYDGIEPTRVLVKLMSDEPVIAHDPSAPRVPLKNGAAIRMRNIHFTYPKRSEPVLRGLNLEIAPGTILGIVGRSGCGKTTIHSLLTRLYDVQEGGVEICGKDVRQWPLSQLRSTFSYVSQNGGVYLSGMRIADILRFTRPDATMRDVVQVAKAACIHDDICRMPMKYRTRIGQNGVSLSKGQQQRVALAQALIAMTAERKILVLDEFTSALDSETEARILQNIEPWLIGQTVIIIAHRLSTLRKLAHEIVVLDEHGIAERGTHSELVDAGGWYSGMVHLQNVSPEILQTST
ncbi:MAG: transporter related [Candidatus Solibacter sp.]|nr:transporter related [Candidatus Solibacter sp.]